MARREDGTLTRRQHTTAIGRALRSMLPTDWLPARNFCRSIFNRAALKANDDVTVNVELEALLLEFERQKERFEVRKLEVEVDALDIDVDDDMRRVGYDSVAWHDKRLSADDTKPTVIASDVTFNVTDPRSGYNKFDCYTDLSPGRHPQILLTAVIVSEDARTFKHNMEFLLHLYPHLATEEWVLLVDGDPAKIQAARSLFPYVIIVLCLKHLQDNFTSRRLKGKAWQCGTSEGLDQTFVCTCRGCGAEMPLPIINDPASALQARCTACCAGSTSSSSSSSSAEAEGQSVGLWGRLCAAAGVIGEAAGALGEAARRLAQASDETLFKNAMDSAVAWNTAWKKLRDSTTLPECKARLDLLAQYHPGVADYTKYLWRNVGSWALCTFVWKPTFGFVFTSNVLLEPFAHTPTMLP